MRWAESIHSGMGREPEENNLIFRVFRPSGMGKADRMCLVESPLAQD